VARALRSDGEQLLEGSLPMSDQGFLDQLIPGELYRAAFELRGIVGVAQSRDELGKLAQLQQREELLGRKQPRQHHVDAGVEIFV